MREDLPLFDWQKQDSVIPQERKYTTSTQAEEIAAMKARRAAKKAGLFPVAGTAEKVSTSAIEDKTIPKSAEPEFIPRPAAKFNILGTMEVVDLPKERKTYHIPERSILDDPTIVSKLKEELDTVFSRRPDPNEFIGAMAGTAYARKYTRKNVEKNIKYAEIRDSYFDQENIQYGKALAASKESGFTSGELLQAIIIDRLNNGWLPNMKGSMASRYDDVAAGIDAAVKYKKYNYFATSFDMTISENDEVVYRDMAEKALQESHL